jgi:uncharacterized membrane protein YhhN
MNMLVLLIVAILFALLDWYAVSKGTKSLEYFAKPGVMLFILLWLGFNSGFSGRLLWFSIGIIFSLAGDIFLMLPNEQFIAGLCFFLLAHLAYITGFISGPIPFNFASLIVLVLIIVVAIRIYRQISHSLYEQGKRKLIPAILLYTIVISTMVISALMTLTGREWPAGSAILVSAGALLFFISDSFLAWNKFVSQLKYGKLAIIITYHCAQLLLSTGAASYLHIF